MLGIISRQKESKKPKNTEAGQMRELCQRRKDNKNDAKRLRAGSSCIQRSATVQTSTIMLNRRIYVNL